jgi:tRNA dimethylallyltransferase
MSPPRVVVLFGATGTGKTGLACAIADRIPCRLVSCDAVQVYRHVDAASAKPSGDELRHPWALVGVADPGDDLNLADWVRAAERELEIAAAAGRVPLVVGGTGLYVRGLLKGIAPAPPRDEALRERLRATASRRGVPFLHRLLSRLDPATAARLQPNDSQRLVRALEVRIAAGASITALQGGAWSGPDRYPALRLGLELPRDLLGRRLDARVEAFFAAGLVDEVRDLLGPRRVPPGANALSGIGYRETAAFLAAAGKEPLESLVAEVRLHTRQYAKRQATWFRRERPAVWFDPREPGLADGLAEAIAAWHSGGPPPAFGRAVV